MTTIKQIQGIKLTTGDELVAMVIEQNDAGDLLVSDPLQMVMNIVPKSKENPEGGMVCNFYPWTIINEGDIWLKAAGIMAHFPVPGDVEKSYYQNTSNLQIVSGAAANQILHG